LRQRFLSIRVVIFPLDPLPGYRLILVIVLNKKDSGSLNYFLNTVQEQTRGRTIDDAVVRG
jgi:hypothetical protein